MINVLKIVKKIIDLAMFLLWTYLLYYRNIGQLLFHAAGGVVFFVLFILHNILNLKWWKSIFKGVYNKRRFLLLVINLLLAVSFVLMIISSVLMSGAIIEWSPAPFTYAGLLLHKWSAKVGYALMILHVLLHIIKLKK